MTKSYQLLLTILTITGFILILTISCEKEEDPVKLPALTTLSVSEITESTAKSGGNIADDGGADITVCGVVWCTSQNPALDSNEGYTAESSGTGEFISKITGLQPGTTYYVIAYATNSAGTGYGQVESFATTGDITEIVEVINPSTGKTWMDRNLGASRAAISSTDEQAYGDLYQWGRADDGHQKITSNITSALSNSDDPGHGHFILGQGSPWDWRSPQNDDLWQGVNGVNNPCPPGYRLPTEAEWEEERLSWKSNNAAGALDSPLKLTLAGRRHRSNGVVLTAGSLSYYWSSTVDGIESRRLVFNIGNASMGSNRRAFGMSVRCLKD